MLCEMLDVWRGPRWGMQEVSEEHWLLWWEKKFILAVYTQRSRSHVREYGLGSA
jgi:hypothetical protein